MSEKRWPSPRTIREARLACERGETLKLVARPLRYVASFFGLSVAMRPANVTARQWAARQNWVTRREKFGANGLSKRGEHALKLNLVKAVIVKQRTPKSKMCKRGHRWTAANTRMTSRGRSCRACEQIMRDGRRWRARMQQLRRHDVERARKLMIYLGVRNAQNPGSVYWRDRYVSARDRWQKLTEAA